MTDIDTTQEYEWENDEYEDILNEGYEDPLQDYQDNEMSTLVHNRHHNE